MLQRSLAGLLFALLLTPSVSAGGKAKGKDDKDKDSFITEIGGRTLEMWIKEIGHKDPGRKATAISTVLLFGPDRAYQALPAILEQMRATVPLDISVRVNAATAVGLIIGSAKDPEPKHVKEAVKLLIRMTSDTQAIVKYRAVQALGRVGVEAKIATVNILPLLSDRMACETRQAAAITLGQIGMDKEKGPDIKVLVELFKTLTDPAAQVRLASIQSLTWLGAPSDPKAKEQLLKSLEPLALKDPEPTVQIWAHMAIMSVMHEITPERIAPVVKMLDHESVPVRLQAAQAIGTIGPKAKSGIPSLVRNLTEKEPAVLMVSIWALGRMEDNATSAVPMLDKLSKDTEQPERIQEAARDAIEQIRGKKDKKSERVP